MDCDICCTGNKINNINICKCSFFTCVECIKKINKITCANCNELISTEIIKLIHTKSDIYKNYFVLSKLNSYNNDQIKKIILREKNKSLLRFGTKNTFTNINYIFKCKNSLCTGYVNSYYTCNLCDKTYCKDCEELKNEDHKCNSMIVLNLKLIKETYKKCPFCFTYIEKSFGCNDMKCIHCGAYFNWYTLSLDKNINSNEYYNDVIINSNLNKEYQNYMINKKINNLKIKDVIFYSTYINKFNIDNVIKSFIKNIINRINRHEKKINKFEYQYFIENKNTDVINKLYYRYKALDYDNKIKQKIYFNPSCTYGKFIDLFNTLSDQIFPSKVTWFISNNYFVRGCSKQKLNLLKQYNYKYIYNKKIIPENFIENNDISRMFDILKKYKFCKYVPCNKTINNIFKVLTLLEVTNVLIIASNMSIKQWQEMLPMYIFKVIFIPIHKINFITKKQNDVVDVINNVFYASSKLKKFVTSKSVLIIENDYMNNNLFNRNVVSYLSYYFLKIKNGYLINITNNHKNDSIYSYLIFKSRNLEYSYIETLNILASLLTKDEIINLCINKINGIKYPCIMKRSNIQFNNKINVNINKDKIHKHYKFDKYIYCPNLVIQDTDKITVYRKSSTFYIYKKNLKSYTKQTHYTCRILKKCIYCKECSGQTYSFGNKNSFCCGIHSLPFMDGTYTHPVHLINNRPILDSISVNVIKILADFKRCSHFTPIDIIEYYLRILGFTVYELNIIKQLPEDELWNLFIDYLVYNTTIHKRNIMNVSLFKPCLTTVDKISLKNAYKNYDHVNNILTIDFKNLVQKGRMLSEQIYLKYIVKYVKNIYNEYWFNTKIIICLCYNENIKDLINMLNAEKVLNILHIYGKTSYKKKNDVLSKFQKINEYKVLIINLLSEIPKVDLSDIKLYIILSRHCKCFEESEVVLNRFYNNNYNYIVQIINI